MDTIVAKNTHEYKGFCFVFSRNYDNIPFIKLVPP